MQPERCVLTTHDLPLDGIAHLFKQLVGHCREVAAGARKQRYVGGSLAWVRQRIARPDGRTYTRVDTFAQWLVLVPGRPHMPALE
jgi:hypothetical protein